MEAATQGGEANRSRVKKKRSGKTQNQVRASHGENLNKAVGEHS